MNRLARIERAAHRLDNWLDRVWLSPHGLTLTLAAIAFAVHMGWLA